MYGAYLDTLILRFDARMSSHLRLDAVYWLDEAVWASTANGSDAPAPAIAAAHARGLQVLWIPYFDAGGAAKWKEFGFDAAWQQPNYFFDGSVPRSRLDSAVRRADKAGMGLELEFDKRILADSGSRRRLRESVRVVRRARNRSVVVYDGAGALYGLLTSTQPELRDAGISVVDLLCER